MGASEAVVVRQRATADAENRDSALVVAVQAGDVGSYEELFRRHHTSVMRVCARRLGDQVEADEAAQATFVRALERIDLCIGERRFGAWVQVIAQRLCMDMIRARTRTIPDDDPLRDERLALNVVIDLDAGTVTEEALVRAERTEKVHEALALLPDRQRAVVVARDLEGRRPPEIAASLGLSVGAVDSLLLRGRRRLAASYEHVLAESSGAPLPVATATGAGVASAGPGHTASMPDALANLVREAVVALPSVPTSGPGTVRRIVVGLAAAVPALLPVPQARSAPPPPPPLPVVGRPPATSNPSSALMRPPPPASNGAATAPLATAASPSIVDPLLASTSAVVGQKASATGAPAAAGHAALPLPLPPALVPPLVLPPAPPPGPDPSGPGPAPQETPGAHPLPLPGLIPLPVPVPVPVPLRVPVPAVPPLVAASAAPLLPPVSVPEVTPPPPPPG